MMMTMLMIRIVLLFLVESVEAEYLGKTVRVDLEDMSVINMFGESGVVVAASAKEQTVSFVTEKKHTHKAKGNHVSLYPTHELAPELR